MLMFFWENAAEAGWGKIFFLLSMDFYAFRNDVEGVNKQITKKAEGRKWGWTKNPKRERNSNIFRDSKYQMPLS